MNNLPLHGLHCFWQTAELGSMKAAAEALFLTPGAVSQQLRQLEERLGVALFERQHRKLVLTTEGARLLPFVRNGFGELTAGLRQLADDPSPNHLAISTLSSFGQQWLVPRLGGLKTAAPELTISLHPTERLVDFDKDDVDLCIRYGRGDYPGLKAVPLMPDALYPVCHPLYQQQEGIANIADLCQCHLLSDTKPDMSWSGWLAAAGCTMAPTESDIQYEGSHLVIEGALALQGVALVRHSLAWRYIQQGLLVRLFETIVPSDFTYYLVAPEAYFDRPKVQQFCQWVQQEAEVFQQASAF